MEQGIVRHRAWGLVIVTATLAALVAPAPAAGHEGLDCGPLPLGGDRFLLEVECFDAADAACDPDATGEHTNATTAAGASGGRVALLPRSGCGVDFANVTFPGAGRVESVRLRGSPWPGATTTVAVLVDGVPAGEAVVAPTAAGEWADALLAGGERVAAGTHRLRVEVSVEGGPAFEDVLLDAVEFVASCRNLPPVTPAIVRADGMGTGNAGWVAHAYNFTGVGGFDPEGDPVTLEWRWGDGTSALGLDAEHAFAEPGAFGVVLVASDDPSARAGCEAGDGASSASAAYPFASVGDWSLALERPVDGESCVHNRTVPSVLGPDVMAGACVVGASAALAGAPDGVLDNVAFRVDGEAFHRDATAPFDAFYSSVGWGTGRHSLDACATARGDRYGRVFCSARYEYVNLGAGPPSV